MPYIITTTTPSGRRDSAGSAQVMLSGPRTAVATLEEARLAVASIYDGIEYTDVEAAMDNCWEAENLPAEGKTIGPLPDGTVIEVRRISWPEIATANGTGMNRRDALAAFNARA